MKPIPVLYFLLFCLGACTSPPTQEVYQRQAEFNEAEYAPYASPGKSTIYGQAFLKTTGGDVKHGAGCTVFLNPVTTYSTEWFQQGIVLGNHRPARSVRLRFAGTRSP